MMQDRPVEGGGHVADMKVVTDASFASDVLGADLKGLKA